MGIFDKIKQVAYYFSGGGANLQLIVDDSFVQKDGKVKVNILCHVNEQDILIDKLYVEIKAAETVKFRQKHPKHGSINGNSTSITYVNEIIVDENFRLEAKGEYEWNVEIFIPTGIAGTYRGINANHDWQLRTCMSKKGKNPESEWVMFIV